MLLEVRGGIAVICVLTVRIYGLRQKSMLLHEHCAFAPFVAQAVPSEDRTLPQSQKIRLAMSHMGQLQTCTKPKGTSALHPNADIRDAHGHVR